MKKKPTSAEEERIENIRIREEEGELSEESEEKKQKECEEEEDQKGAFLATLSSSSSSSSSSSYFLEDPHWLDEEISSLQHFDIPIDPRSYLEVIDLKRRYGKNLRLYYKHYQESPLSLFPPSSSLTYSLPPPSPQSSCTSSSSSSSFQFKGDNSVVATKDKYSDFFEWLDSEPKPEVEGCPRSLLDMETVFYCQNKSEAEQYRVEVSFPSGLLVNAIDGSLLTTISSSQHSNTPPISQTCNAFTSAEVQNSIPITLASIEAPLKNKKASKLGHASSFSEMTSFKEQASGLFEDGADKKADGRASASAKESPSSTDNEHDDEDISGDTEAEHEASESDSDSDTELEDLDVDVVESVDSPELDNSAASPRSCQQVGDSSSEKDASDGPLERWIFVMKHGSFFCHPKVTKSFPRFQHSSFFAGAPVDAAGIFSVRRGRIEELHLHSGHYRPTEIHLYRLLLLLRRLLTDDIFSTIQVDAQRILHVARMVNSEGSKMKKALTTFLWPATYMLDFLACKKRMWGAGVFRQIHTRRRKSSDVVSVAPMLSGYESPFGECEFTTLSRSQSSGPVSPQTFAALFGSCQDFQYIA